MTKETIEILVKVNIWYDDNAGRNRAIATAKDAVLASSASFVEPKSSKLIKTKANA